MSHSSLFDAGRMRTDQQQTENKEEGKKKREKRGISTVHNPIHESKTRHSATVQSIRLMNHYSFMSDFNGIKRKVNTYSIHLDLMRYLESAECRKLQSNATIQNMLINERVEEGGREYTK